MVFLLLAEVTPGETPTFSFSACVTVKPQGFSLEMLSLHDLAALKLIFFGGFVNLFGKQFFYLSTYSFFILSRFRETNEGAEIPLPQIGPPT